MYLSLSCCRVTPSQHPWVVICLVFLLVSSLGLLRENAPAADVLFLNWSSVMLAKSASWWACVPTQTSLWIFPSMLGKQKLKFTTCFGTRLGIYCDESVDHSTDSSRIPFLPAFCHPRKKISSSS